MRDKEIVSEVAGYLKTVEDCFLYRQNSGFSQPAAPIIIICFKGKFIGLKVKVGSGKVTVLQEVTLRRIRKAGGIAETVRSVEDVRRILSGLR